MSGQAEKKRLLNCIVFSPIYTILDNDSQIRQ